MRTPRLDTTLENRKAREKFKVQSSKFGILLFLTFHFPLSTFHYPVVCHSTLPCLIDTHLGLITSILDPEESSTDCICFFRWLSRDESMIDLFDLVILEICEQRFKCWLILGDKYTTARISVDTMDECRTECQAIILAS